MFKALILVCKLASPCEVGHAMAVLAPTDNFRSQEVCLMHAQAYVAQMAAQFKGFYINIVCSPIGRDA